MIDTHTHLYLEDFSDDNNGRRAVERAFDVGVEHLIFPNVDLGTVEPMRNLAALYPGKISCAMGLHPTEVYDGWKDTIARIFEYLGNGSDYVAIGEIGMDLYWEKSHRNEQMEAFAMQAMRARDLGLPLIIHCREALDETLEVMSDYRDVPAVFHSFGGSVDDIEKIRRVGDFYFGINGIVTFKNSRLRDVLADIGLDRILLETDSPYLAPVPFRGKRNESSYLPVIAAHIAQHMEVANEVVINRTTENAHRLFPKIGLIHA